jgi:hypothetical protein
MEIQDASVLGTQEDQEQGLDHFGSHYILAAPKISLPLTTEVMEKTLPLAEKSVFVADALGNAAGIAGGGMAVGCVATVAGIAVDKFLSVSSADEATIEQLRGAIDYLGGVNDYAEVDELPPETQTLIGKMGHLALDVLENSGKTKGFLDGDCGSFGKKTTLSQLQKCLKELRDLQKNENLSAEVKVELDQFLVGVEVASTIVGEKLNRARWIKSLNLAGKALVAGAGIIKSMTPSGLATVSTLAVVKMVAATLGSVNSIVLSKLGEDGDLSKIPQQFEELLDTLVTELPPDMQHDIEKAVVLALDVRQNPEKSRGFIDGEGNILGKKGVRNQLRRWLKVFNSLIKSGKISSGYREKFDLVYKDVKTALKIVSRKLNKARATKTAKIGAVTLGVAAAVTGAVATFGVGTVGIIPAIGAACSLLGATVNVAHTGYELSASKK